MQSALQIERKQTSSFEAGTVWLRTLGGCSRLETEICSALVAEAIRIEHDINGPYGVVCFDEVDTWLIQLLHETSRNSRQRVLAVAATPDGADPATIWRLLHAGAADVVPWNSGEGAERICAKLARWREVDRIAAQALREQSMIGESPAWHTLIRKVVEAALFSAIPILLTGESGTGKELLSRLVSVVSSGGSKSFRNNLITVDCGSLVPELSGSEFFGHERGAFTGAHVQREGAFAMADGATLLLDEIGEVPLNLQVQLLRAIQEKTYKRVGSNVWQKTNFRLVCATNRNLEELVQRGQFRQDLYYRIAGCVFHTPTLAERKTDILPLAKHFLGDHFPRGVPEFDRAVREYLLNREYKGNIRELRQLTDRIAHAHAGEGAITAGDIPEEDRPLEGEVSRAWPDVEFERSLSNALATGVTLKEITQSAADTVIRLAIQAEESNLQRAASRLGVTDRALQLRRANARVVEPAAVNAPVRVSAAGSL